MLLGRPIYISTDYKSLTHLNKSKLNHGRLSRWFLYLQEFDIRMIYIPGKQNTIADYLSRINKKNNHKIYTSNFVSLHKSFGKNDKINNNILKESGRGEGMSQNSSLLNLTCNERKRESERASLYNTLSRKKAVLCIILLVINALNKKQISVCLNYKFRSNRNYRSLAGRRIFQNRINKKSAKLKNF